MSNFSNKCIKAVAFDKQQSDNALKMQVEKIKIKDIKTCIEERIKNDQDIDAIRFAITSNQKTIKIYIRKNGSVRGEAKR